MIKRMNNSHWRWPLITFVLTWFVVVGGVYPNGDDIAHLSGQIHIEQFVPMLAPHWIPNRIVDMYGRTLLTKAVEWWYGILHPWTGMDFLRVYQLLSASVMATFTAAVFAYIDRSAQRSGYTPRFIARISLLVLLLTLLSWRNQVHLMAYQLPAVLNFILLWELQYWIRPQNDGKTFNRKQIPSLCLLAYLAAFSMEAYAVQILIVWPWIAFSSWKTLTKTQHIFPKNNRLHAAFVLAFTAALQIMALLIVTLFSERVKIVNTSGIPNTPHLSAILEGELGWFMGPGRFFTMLGVIGLAFWAWHIRKTSSPDATKNVWPELLRSLSFAGIVTLASILMVMLVSYSTGQNYFSHHQYPWGDLLLVTKLTLTCGIFHCLSRLENAPWLTRTIITLSFFALTSRLTIIILDGAARQQSTASTVAQAYHIAQTTKNTLIDTGLNLAKVHETIKPLPTVDSPTWFQQGYQNFFHKYYGVSHTVHFR